MNLRKLKKKQDRIESLRDINGKTILLTGRIPKYTRTTIEKRIRELGGYIVTKAESYVDICVYTRTDTTKYITAMRINRTYNSNMLFVKGDDFVTHFLKLE